MSAKVLINNINKAYQETHILRRIYLDIAPGEFIVVVGPSGCGKSSLLRMIAGLESITQGKIFIDNVCINRLSPKDRDIAMVFQNYALYPHMTVYDNMAYGLKRHGFSKSDIKQRIDDAASILQIKDYLLRKPKQLSGGQRQRVAMGRAIVRQPKVFLFDEPLSNLDAKLRTQMRLEIRKLHQRLGITSIYVTHDQVEAMTLADRIMVLNQGSIEQVDRPQVIYERPQSVFVANFMGTPSINLIDMVWDDARSCFSYAKNPKICLKFYDNTISHGRYILGIRPEDIALHAVSHAQRMDMRVQWVESLGADKLFYCSSFDNSLQLTVRVDSAYTCCEDQPLSLWLPADKLHIFDAETKVRLNTTCLKPSHNTQAL